MAKIPILVAVATLLLVQCDAFLVPQSYIGKPYKAQADKCTMTSFSPGSAFLPTRASNRLRAVGTGRRAGSGLCQLKSQMKPGTDEAEKTKQIDLDFEGLKKQFAIFWKMATPYVRFLFLCPTPALNLQPCGKTFNRLVFCRRNFAQVLILIITPFPRSSRRTGQHACSSPSSWDSRCSTASFRCNFPTWEGISGQRSGNE
jgi:hypothetical protein